MSLRTEKLNSLIQHHVSEILMREISFKPGLFVSVSKVDTTSDLRYTRIFLSVFPAPEKDYVEATLKKEMYRIQGSLNKKMQIKVLPKISFLFEDTQEKVSKLDKIFDQIKKEQTKE